VRADRADVVEAQRVGPVLREHALAVGVTLDLPYGVPDAGPLQTQLETPYARE
jgi:hypothetical protein